MRNFILLFVLFAIAVTAVSCGGSGGGGTTAQASLHFSITWPERSRLIPIAANSIRVRVLMDGAEIKRVIIPRPSGSNTSNVTVTDLPPQTVVIDATAYPNIDATGTPQAFGKVGLTLVGGIENDATVTMASTITSLTLAVDNTAPLVGEDVPVSASAQNAGNALVLVSDATVTWSSSDPSVLKPDAQGTSAFIHALKAGSVTLTATETESNVSASIPITVIAPYTLEVVPTVVDATGTDSWTYHVYIKNHTDHSVLLQDLALDHYDKDGAFVVTQWVKDDVPTFSFTYWAINHSIFAGGTEDWTIITNPGNQVGGQLAEMTVLFRATIVDGVTQTPLTGEVQLTRDGVFPLPPVLGAIKPASSMAAVSEGSVSR